MPLAFKHSGIVEHESADETRLVTACVVIQGYLTEGLPESS